MGVLLNTLGRVDQTRNLRKLLGDVCTILDTLEGIGCSIDRTGNRWKINVNSAGGLWTIADHDGDSDTVGNGQTVTLKEGTYIDVDKTDTRQITVEAKTDSTTPEDVGATGTHSVGGASKLAKRDHRHRAPHWNEMQDADATTNLIADTDNAYNLNIGTQAKEWIEVAVNAQERVDLFATNAADNASSWLYLVSGDDAAGAQAELKSDGDVTIESEGGYLVLSGLPTTSPGGSNRVWNDSGTLKIT